MKPAEPDSVVSEPWWRQLLRYAFVGAGGTIVQYLVLWLGVTLWSASAVVASAIGYLIATVVNYLLHYFHTFESDQEHPVAVTRYYLVVASGWCINTALMAVLVEHEDWHYLIAQILTTFVGLLWNFAGNRFWTFGVDNHTQESSIS